VENYSPSANHYLFPLQKGATSNLKSVQTTGEKTFDLDIQLKVVGEEEVETPAGKMRAIKVERVAKWKQRKNNNAGVNTFVYWYNSAVKRYVLGEISNVTAEGKVVLKERYELASFEVK
jgi:hypothetical protein